MTSCFFRNGLLWKRFRGSRDEFWSPEADCREDATR